VPSDETIASCSYVPSSSNALEFVNQDNNLINIPLAEKDPISNHNSFKNTGIFELSN